MPSKPARRMLDARPDRADFRDRIYQPPLRSLPEQHPLPDLVYSHLQAYHDANLILDQGKEGACTGFGLAAVINYIYWSRWRMASTEWGARNSRESLSAGSKPPPKPPRVSPHMLFRNARIYDEWEGSGYDWSSCRGAMKGWYKHGVCEEAVWPSPGRRPKAEWSNDAALRPLGAYYRVNAKSISDMQAAIHEVHAVYCSADVHKGWDKPKLLTKFGTHELAVIEHREEIDGGHAFAVVGYNRDGFIVQNSWGPDWGTNGFALLTYKDWAKNGYDAWVAALGAPMNVGIIEGAGQGNRTGGMMSAALTSLAPPPGRKMGKADTAGVPPWDESLAYRHAVVLGNDGVVIDRLPEAVDAADAVKIVATERTRDSGCDRVAVYVHGGLNDEDDAITRARRLGPWFAENGIHPVFVVWKTGILEAVSQIAGDNVKKREEEIAAIRTRGIGDFVEAAIDKARDAFDLGFEALAEKFIAKAVWTQMKQNAEMSARPGRGMAQLAKALKDCGKPVHLLGHSAGSIIIGHLLDVAQRVGLKFDSCGLYAPACTLEFANRKYGPALARGGALHRSPLHIDVLTDEAETRDHVAKVYGKSLLYLVSRALEEQRKMPLLGLAIALEAKGRGPKMEFDSKLHGKLFQQWAGISRASGQIVIERHGGPEVKVSARKSIQIAHGTFDNDCAVVNASLKRIRGGKLKRDVTDLTGF